MGGWCGRVLFFANVLKHSYQFDKTYNMYTGTLYELIVYQLL